MMKTKLRKLVAISALLGASSAFALPQPVTLTNADGAFTDFVGIDWDSLGNVVIKGFTPVTGTVVTLDFYASASTLNLAGGGTVPEGGMKKNLGDTGTYEYTVFGSLTATATCSSPTSCTFTVNSGSFTAYYDEFASLTGGAAANYKTGAGFTDGDLLFSGTVGAQPGGGFNTFGPDGFGVASIIGTIDMTNSAYIMPDLASANSLTTLSIGIFNTSGWDIADITGVAGAAGAGVAIPAGALVLQGDMSSELRSVPEPATLALLGLALGGLGVLRRRKNA